MSCGGPEEEVAAVDGQDNEGIPAPGDEIRELYAQARDLYSEGRFAEVVEMCEVAEGKGMYNPDIAAVHSAALLKMRRPREAVEFLNSMLYHFPQDARLHLNLGSAHRVLFHSWQAREEYKIARRLDPELAGGRMNSLLAMRVVIGLVSFVVFFIAFAFWPHSRWFIVGLVGALALATAYALYLSVAAKSRISVWVYVVLLVVWGVIIVLLVLL